MAITDRTYYMHNSKGLNSPAYIGGITMKIIEMATMPDGTHIQLEDWSEHNSNEYPDLYGFTIGAYPIAKNTGKYGWVQGGKTFRLSISHNKFMEYTNDNVKEDFEALKNGTKRLQDLAKHFWYGQKDMWYLGMDVEYQGW